MSSPSCSISPFAFLSHKLGHIISDDVSVNQINQILNDTNNMIAATHLCHFGFIVTTIAHLEYTLNQCQEEKLEIFAHMMMNKPFQDVLCPIFQDHQHWTRQSGFHPYTHRPLTPQSSPPLPSKSPSNSSSSSNYETTNNSPGLPQNPINVDQFNQKVYDNKKFQETLDKTRIPPQFKPTCEWCNQYRHENPNCNTPIRLFVHCDVCKFFNQLQSMYCKYYDLSPVAFHRLQGNIPYNDSN